MSALVADLTGKLWHPVATIRLVGRSYVKKNSRALWVDAGAKPRSAPSAKYREWAKVAELVAMSQWREGGRFKAVGSAEQAVWLRIEVRYDPRHRPDASNAYQGVEDVLQAAGVLANDRWVAHHDGSRLVADAAGEQVVVRILVEAT